MGIIGQVKPARNPQRKAVFLDRDGVINRAVVRDGKPYPPASVDEMILLPRVGEALHALKAAGFMLIVVTTQPDVARGTTPRAAVDAIHEALMAALPLDEIRCCFHDDHDACSCRKPKPGALLDAAAELKKHNISPDRLLVFENPMDAGKALQEIIRPGDLILAKGSQGMRMEKVVEEVMAEPDKATELLCRQTITWRNKAWKEV